MAAGTPKLKASRKWKVSEKGTTQATRVYYVPCDDKDDGAEVAAAVCPDIGDAFDDDNPQLLVVDVDVDEKDQLASGALYEVTVDYSTESDNPNGGGTDGSNHPDPTERPGILRLSYEDVEEPIYKQLDRLPIVTDADGAAIDISATWSGGTASIRQHMWDYRICNSVGKPFAEGLRESFAEAVYTFEKNVTTLDWVRISTILDAYVNTVNSDTVAISYRGATKVFSKQTLLLKNPSSEPGYENGVQFEKVTFQLRFRRDGWRRKQLDQGTSYYLGGDVTPQTPPLQVLDSFGEPILNDEPVLLDGKGDILKTGKPVFLSFRTRELKKFGGLPFAEIS